MAEFSVRRVVIVAAIAGALVGGAVAAGVAVVSTNGNADSPVSSPGASTSVTTATVVRTNLTSTVQEGGSIGFEGSYNVAAPSGASTQEVAQAQQTVTQDQQTASDDEQAESDAATGGNQAIALAQISVNTTAATLSSDEAKQAQDCAGTGASTAMCSQDAQMVSSDQAALTQANQQLASAQSTATSQHHQNQAKVASDQTKLQGDEATLASLQATAVGPGTTYTALPKVGDVISQDQSVYWVSNEPVPLLYGSITAYRAFFVGMSDGADIGELTEDLIALGYGGGLTESNHYSSATATAVERWQSALGLPATGKVLLGQVVFEPGPIRITSVMPSVGASVGSGGDSAEGGGDGGTVLGATTTTPDVTVDLEVSQEYLVKPGDPVSIVLPNATSTVGGHIESVGNVATCPGGGGIGIATGAINGSSTADQSPCSSSGGGSSTPTVTVTVTLDSVPELATLDQAPVNVDITTQRATNVLAVPVSALLALQGGGFGVDVVSDTTSHLVGVTTGLYSNNLVQISRSGITVGTRVQVPSS